MTSPPLRPSTSPRALLLAGALLALVAAQGCVSPPLGALRRAPDAQLLEVLDESYIPFRVSPENKYALVMSGRRFLPPGGPISISTAEDVLQGVPETDPWIEGDIQQLTTLLLSKGYDVYQIDYGRVTPAALRELCQRVGYAANPETRLFVAYSGEGDATGWRTRTLTIAENQHLVPPGVTVTPKDLFAALAPIPGPKAVLINACEAGIFADAATGWGEFSGVVIAACAKGFATTPHEPSGTTAIVAAFLALYADDPTRELNLATVELDRAGGWWTNLAHRWNRLLGGGGLPLSYEPAVFVSGDFWL